MITNKDTILNGAYKLYESTGQWLFSRKEHFPEMPKGSWRNAICDLKGKEKKVKRMTKEQYALVDCIPDSTKLLEQIIDIEKGGGTIGVKRHEIDASVTIPLSLNTLNPIQTCLQAALWDPDNNIHDLTLTTFIPDLFRYLKSEGHEVDSSNKGIKLISTRINDLSLKAFVYDTDTIEIFVSNSNNPIMVNVQDIKRLRQTLEQFRIYLGQYTVNVPKLDYGFKVVKFDYAHDGIVPISVSFTYNYYNFEGELLQIYTKRSNEFLTQFRFEKRNLSPNEQCFAQFEQQFLNTKALMHRPLNSH